MSDTPLPSRASAQPAGFRGLKGLKKRRRVQLILAAFTALAISTALIGYAMRDGINYFRSPSQMADSPPRPGEVFRLGGLVEEGTLVRGQGTEITFRVTDGGASVPVTYTGMLPDLFGEGEGVVATGSMQGAVFAASEILARHDESYLPREVIDALDEQGMYVESPAPGG